MAKPFLRMEIEPTDDGGFQIDVTPNPPPPKEDGKDNQATPYGSDQKRYVAKSLEELQSCIADQCGAEAPDAMDTYTGNGNKKMAQGQGNDETE